MVKEKYKCPYCRKDHEDLDDAILCAQGCVNIENPISVYCCEICGANYNKKSKAENCEKEHIKHKDQDYVDYERKENFRKLKAASKLPGQKTLIHKSKKIEME